MKNPIKILFTFLTLFLVFACNDDHLNNIDLGGNLVKNQNPSLILQTPGETGGLILPKEDYSKIPQLDYSSIKPLDGFELNQRSSIMTLNTPPVMDQGNEFSCVASAIGYCFTGYLRRNSGVYSNSLIPSPEYIYNNTKTGTACTSGAFANTTFNFLLNNGSASQALMPYSSQNGCTNLYPPGYAPVMKSEKKFNPKTGQYYTYTYIYYPPFPKIFGFKWTTVPRNSEVIKILVQNGYPIVIGFAVDENFDRQTTRAPYTYLSRGGNIRGNHFAVIMGYDDTKKVFKVQNSWGAQTHDKGYFYLPYELVANLLEIYSYTNTK